MRFRLLVILSLMWAAASAQASQPVSYHARLSRQDHYDAKGRKLESVPAILARDRANYHRFHRRDASDQSDSFFTTESHRALFYKMKIVYRNFGNNPSHSVITEFLDVDVKVSGLTVYLTVSAG